MIALTVVVHVVGIIVLTRLLRGRVVRKDGFQSLYRMVGVLVFRPQGLVAHDRGEHASCRPAPHFVAVRVPDGDIEALSVGEL